MKPRIMVDMSATLIHHGHVRLLAKAAAFGTVVVALTTDDGVRDAKGYVPELAYEHREEILKSIVHVSEVVPCPWLIDEAFLDRHQCEFLVHGDDNCNHIPPHRLKLFPRTEGISSSTLRERVLDCLVALNPTGKPNGSSEKIARLLIESVKKEFKLE